MRCDDAIAQLKMTEPVLRALGVKGLYRFGSLACDEADAGSDVGVFVDPAFNRDFRFSFVHGGVRGSPKRFWPRNRNGLSER
jgi:predicted nucleotidyltransferase